ncbi:hypothetical protein GIB67_038394, partial [Kingdonia uniflora]
GQYRVEGTTDKCFVAIFGSGQKWKVNLEKFECQCREWELTGLPCVHVVCVLIPMRHPWIEYYSEYHTVAKYVTTFQFMPLMINLNGDKIHCVTPTFSEGTW